MVGIQVGTMKIADKIEGLLEVGFDSVELQLCSGEPVFDGVEFTPNAILLDLEQWSSPASVIILI